MKRILQALIRRYAQDKVAQNSAALAYYMLFAFFPFILLIGKIFELLHVPIARILEQLYKIIPDEVLLIARQHMEAPAFHNILAVVTWVLLAIYFFVRSINAFLLAIERAQGVRVKRHSARRFLLSLLLALLNMPLLFLLIALIVAGGNLLKHISTVFPLPPTLITIWHYGRFLILAALIFAILFLFYAAASIGQGIRRKELLPGALAAAFGWLLISVCFSYYVSSMGRYSLLYGSLGAVIVLLLWLYLSSLIIVMGAELNGILRMRGDEAPDV